MDIKFCSITNESIPDGEFEAGRAITVGGRSYYVSAALQRLMARGRFRGWLAFGLGLYAAAATTFLLVQHAQRTEVDPNAVSTAVVAAIDERVQASQDTLADAIHKRSQALEERIATGFELASRERGTLTENQTALKRAHESALQDVKDRFSAVSTRQLRTETELTETRSWLLKIQGTAEDLIRRLAEVRAQAVAPAAPPPEAATQPDTPPAEAAPDAAEVQRKKDEELLKWVERLKDKSNDMVFTATVKLGELGDLRAATPLVEVLLDHDDFYSRLGAATTLGTLKAVDGVEGLIEALADKDDLVRDQSNESLMGITGQDFGFSASMSRNERNKVQRKWRNWFKENETALRERMGQMPSQIGTMPKR